MTVHTTNSYLQNSIISKSSFVLNYSLSTVKKEINIQELSLLELKSMLYERFIFLRKTKKEVSLKECIDELSKEIPLDILHKLNLV